MTETRELELRTFELRVAEDGQYIEGMLVPYERWTTIGAGPFAFREMVRRGAFRDYLEGGGDVVYNYGHDRRAILGRRSSGTFTVTEREDGVHGRLLIPDTTLGRDMREMVKRGDIAGHSIEFVTELQQWDDEGEDTPESRVILKARLPGVALTHVPAYQDTTAALRSRDAHHAEKVIEDLKMAEARVRALGLEL